MVTHVFQSFSAATRRVNQAVTNMQAGPAAPLEEPGRRRLVRDPWRLIGWSLEVCGGRPGLWACLHPSEALLEQHLMGAANYTWCH